MASISQKRSKVKKKKKTASKKTARKSKAATTRKKKKRRPVSEKVKSPAKKKKAASKKPAKKKKVASATTKRGTKAVKKVNKKKVKKRAKARQKKKGVLRAQVDKILGTRRSQAQVLERLSEKLPGIFKPNMIETDESLMMQRLIRAEQLGEFDTEARKLSNEFDWNLRAVYELWHSPDVYF